MRLQLSRAHHPVTALGPGRRIGIWFQGCDLGCGGCLSQDTWPSDHGRAIDVEALLDWCRGLRLTELHGVTISGGEPFQQPEALVELLRGLDTWRRGSGASLDLLAFTGHSLVRARRLAPEALALLDAIVAGPYVESRPTDHPLMGSANQRLEPLTALGRDRYAEAALDGERRRFQVAVDERDVWYVGIPRRGDLGRLQEEMERRGVEQEQPSWLM